MVTYDPTVIAKVADRMYERASALIFTYTVVAFVIGAAVGGLGAMSLSRGNAQAGAIGAGVLGLLLGMLGHTMGTNAALKLRFDAQQMLLMLQIEKNTRARVT